MKSISNEHLCPCSSGKSYGLCCKLFHEGGDPPSALFLMRSRFAAYALDLPDYIMATTHKKNPQYQEDKRFWKRDLSRFSKDYLFESLEILESTEFTVTFTAHIFRYHRVGGRQDCSFTEKSFFEQVEGKWLYLSGQ